MSQLPREHWSTDWDFLCGRLGIASSNGAWVPAAAWEEDERHWQTVRAINERVIYALVTGRSISQPDFTEAERSYLVFLIRHGRFHRSWGGDSLVAIDRSLSWRTGMTPKVTRNTRLSLHKAGYLTYGEDAGRYETAVWITHRFVHFIETKRRELALRKAFGGQNGHLRWEWAVSRFVSEAALMTALLELYDKTRCPQPTEDNVRGWDARLGYTSEAVIREFEQSCPLPRRWDVSPSARYCPP